MEASTEQRIRLLAIAIQGMDPDDADRLLEHMPAQHAQRIRFEVGRLDDVTDQERSFANETIERLLLAPQPTPSPSASIRELSQTEHQSTGLDCFAESIEDYPIEAILNVLSAERPIVVATILSQLPSRLGQTIVQRLDLELAQEALDWIPRIGPTDSRILESLFAEFEGQVRRVSSMIQTQHHGEEKVRLLRAVLEPTQTLHGGLGLGGLSDHSVASSNSVPGSQPGQPSSRPFVIPLNRKSSREEALEVILNLDDLDLLRVLYSHQPGEVKRFLAGANKALRLRVESLTPPQGLKKLRRELASVPICDEKTWRELASLFTKTAMELDQNQSSEETLRIPA